MAQFIGNIILRAKIECLTGLHIGAGKDTAQIGGIDAPVVRDLASRQPYIPGSSLKGKMRSLLEFGEGLVRDGEPHNCDSPTCKVCRAFGSSAQERTCGPTRLLVRDAYPDQRTREMWDRLDTELVYTEMKSENYLNRITSAANPRFIERVVKGSRFNLELVYGVYQVDSQNDLDYFGGVGKALRLLEDSTLGGHGSRGYGQVRFHLAPPVLLGKSAYQDGGAQLKAGREWPADEAFSLSPGDLNLDAADPALKSWSEASA